MNNISDNQKVSIIICTHNRAYSLQRTLDSVSRLDIPTAVDLEIIVVDNKSSDHTKTVVQKFSKINNLKYLYEKQQGLSFARNLGIRNSHGDTLLFTDDDVCPDSKWLAQIILNFEIYNCDACGGYIAPVWESAPPFWLTELLYGFIAVRTEDNGPREMVDPNDMPFGANMAFKRNVFDEIGFFDENRGRKGKILASGEDGELFQRLLKNNFKIMYFPSAKVYHHIESYRTKKAYFRRWRRQNSKNLALTTSIQTGRGLFGVPFYLFPQMIRAIVTALHARKTLPPDEAFYKEIIVWHFIGLIQGLFLKK